jgi:2',3'-cyclic-nucleotide 2'-phosphodiesterase (5'-nucleotidase family)
LKLSLQVNRVKKLRCYILTSAEKDHSVSRVKLALLNTALLLCLLATTAHITFSQATARATPAPTPTTDVHAKVTETLVDSSIPGDKAVDKMLEGYAPKVRALDQVIGRLKTDLRKGGTGVGSLGNFVTDAMRAEASRKLGTPVLLTVTNGGGLRKPVIAAGDVRLRDIFELLPFENALVAFDLTGAQVLDLLRVVVLDRDAQSGARVTYRIDADKRAQLESARFLVDGVEKEIDPAALYTVISIDYLLKVTGGDYAEVLKQAKNTRPLGITIRDAITDYIKTETAAGREINSTLDGRFVFDKANSAVMEETRP